MKLYKIEFNKCGYDQYNGFVVIANDELSAIKTLKKEHPLIITGKNYLEESWSFEDTSINWEGGYKIEEIKDDGISRVILESFNAG